MDENLNNNKRKKKDEKLIQNKRIPILVTEEEKSLIEKAAKKAETSTSEFVRQAVFDKLKRIQNPELYNLGSLGAQTLSPELLTQLMNKQNEALELQKEMLNRSKIFDEFKKDLKLLQKYSSKQGLENERETIINLFKGHKSLNAKSIIEKTGYDKDIVWQILSDDKIFKKNIDTGRFELND